MGERTGCIQTAQQFNMALLRNVGSGGEEGC